MLLQSWFLRDSFSHHMWIIQDLRGKTLHSDYGPTSMQERLMAPNLSREQFITRHREERLSPLKKKKKKGHPSKPCIRKAHRNIWTEKYEIQTLEAGRKFQSERCTTGFNWIQMSSILRWMVGTWIFVTLFSFECLNKDLHQKVFSLYFPCLKFKIYSVNRIYSKYIAQLLTLRDNINFFYLNQARFSENLQRGNSQQMVSCFAYISIFLPRVQNFCQWWIRKENEFSSLADKFLL